MAHIEIIDQTLRDGQQSLWGMRMQAGMALPVAPAIDRAGYSVVDLVGSSMFEVMVRHAQEDPWAGLDLLVQAMPRSRIRAGMRCHGIITMSVTPDALMDLWVRRLCEHGVKSFWIHDPLHCNFDKLHRLAKVAKEYDAEVVLAVMYTLSPVHTDAFYAEKARALAASPHVDRLILYDTAGALLPERARTLVPTVIAAAGGKRVEIHSHNVTGIAPLTYLAAIECGIDVIHTCSKPLANGASLPSIEMSLRNLGVAGHTHGIDARELPAIAAHFEQVARANGFALGVPNEYDLMLYEHQIPGGMTGTLKNQLAQHGKSDRLDEVLREISVVRRELGYPAMATPFSQLVGVLAVMNVISGRRYDAIPDEVLQYAYGWYGPTVAAIAPEVMDRIDSHPRARDFRGSAPPQPSLAEIRRDYGDVDDDELLLRFLVAPQHIERMRAAGRVRRDSSRLGSAEMEQVAQLLRESRSASIQLRSASLQLALQRNPQ
jgi:oxaloacetate decarboxylase alpha subunit